MQKKVSWWKIFKRTFAEFSDDKVMKLSAALAYYTIFSLPPMLLVVISLTGLIYGREAIEGKVYSHLTEVVGNNAAAQIESTIKNVHLSGKSKIATIIGFVTLFLGATGIFTEIQDSINTIWGIVPKPRRGWLALILNRALSFALVIGMGFLLVVSLLLNAILAYLGTKLGTIFPNLSVYLLLAANYALTFLIITVLFATIYKVLPDARIAWKDALIGSVATAILFMIGKFAIGEYLQHSNLASAYGAAGSIVIIMVWVYYSSITLYFGAEFTHAYSHSRGGKITPREYAVVIDKNI